MGSSLELNSLTQEQDILNNLPCIPAAATLWSAGAATSRKVRRIYGRPVRANRARLLRNAAAAALGIAIPLDRLDSMMVVNDGDECALFALNRSMCARVQL
jgi:hypothetical protein